MALIKFLNLERGAVIIDRMLDNSADDQSALLQESVQSCQPENFSKILDSLERESGLLTVSIDKLVSVARRIEPSNPNCENSSEIYELKTMISSLQKNRNNQMSALNLISNKFLQTASLLEMQINFSNNMCDVLGSILWQLSSSTNEANALLSDDNLKRAFEIFNDIVLNVVLSFKAGELKESQHTYQLLVKFSAPIFTYLSTKRGLKILSNLKKNDLLLENVKFLLLNLPKGKYLKFKSFSMIFFHNSIKYSSCFKIINLNSLIDAYLDLIKTETNYDLKILSMKSIGQILKYSELKENILLSQTDTIDAIKKYTTHRNNLLRRTALDLIEKLEKKFIK